jgi:molybdate/tungstate transport system substrate-binding protein
MPEVASMERSQAALVAILLVILAVFGSLYYAWNAKFVGSQSEGTVNVLYAGSLLDTMEHGIGPTFATMGYDYTGEGHGSVQNANFVIDGQRSPDVFISAGVPPIQMLENNIPPLAKWYVVFASDEIVIAYSNKSRFVGLFNEASQGTIPWYLVLAAPQIRFLRTDPEQDPKGYYMIMVAKLANGYYGNSSISSLILRGDRNPSQIRPEEVLITLLESGECDAIPLYRHEAVERGLPFITLPPQINLGVQSYADSYKQASYTLQTNKTVYGQPIVFAVTIPTTAKNSDGAVAFVKFLLSDTGQQTLRKHGFSQVHFVAGGDPSAIPPAIAAIVNSQS